MSNCTALLSDPGLVFIVFPLFFVSVWGGGAAGLGPVELGRKSLGQDEERQIRSGQASRELHTQVLLSFPILQAGSLNIGLL